VVRNTCVHHNSQDLQHTFTLPRRAAMHAWAKTCKTQHSLRSYSMQLGRSTNTLDILTHAAKRDNPHPSAQAVYAMWKHLSEADDVGVQQRPVIQQLPLHVHVDLQQRIISHVRHHQRCNCEHYAHLCAPLNEFGCHILAGLQILHEHRDAEIASAQLSHLQQDQCEVWVSIIQPTIGKLGRASQAVQGLAVTVW
jgi:hypothetical protein